MKKKRSQRKKPTSKKANVMTLLPNSNKLVAQRQDDRLRIARAQFIEKLRYFKNVFDVLDISDEMNGGSLLILSRLEIEESKHVSFPDLLSDTLLPRFEEF